MKCPKCGSMNFEVIDTRNRTHKPYIYRIRVCLECGERFKTHEIIVGDINDDYVRGYEQAKSDVLSVVKNIGGDSE